MKTLEGTNQVRVEHTYIGPAGSRSGLGRSIVTMVQPAESLLRMDPTRSYGADPAFRCPFLKSEMRTVLMMVTNIRGEQSLQMAFIQRNNLVQQVSPTASHPTLRDAILPGTPEGSSLGNDPGRFHRCDNLEPEFLIAIKDQVFMRGFKGKRLT